MKIQYPSFSQKSELFAYLVKNQREITDLKKAAIKFADGFTLTQDEETTVKAFVPQGKEDTDSTLYRTIIGNTYNWMDSHDDVHLDGCFAKSISERKSRIWHLHDHLHQITAKVGIPQNIYESYIDWTKLGVAKAGQTQALFMDSQIQKELNPQIFKGYQSGDIQQHSVGMQYVLLVLCVNDPEYKEEFANWTAYIDLIGNREKAEDKGYFWAVREAKLIEISCVLEGSNALTPTLESKAEDTVKEPEVSTPEQPEEVNVFDIGAAIKNTKFFN